MELPVKGHYSSSVPENLHGVGPGWCDRLQLGWDSPAGTSVGAGVAREDLSQLDG